MNTTAFCYHCRAHHPLEDMRQITTKAGKRWRCIKSIEATKADRATREAYGRSVTENNKAQSASSARIANAARTLTR
jgi:hypothetical protein